MYHKWHISPPYFRENIIFHITEYEVSYKSLKLIDYDISNALSLQQISKNKFNHLIEMHINYIFLPAFVWSSNRASCTKPLCFIELRILMVNGPQRSPVYYEVLIMKRSNNDRSFKIRHFKEKIQNRSKENTDLYKAKRWNQVPWRREHPLLTGHAAVCSFRNRKNKNIRRQFSE